MSGGRRADVLLALGAMVGVAAAAFGVAGPRADRRRAMPAGAVALVNGSVVTAADYQRSVDAIAKDRRDGGSPALRRRALNRLIDEELLAQRGVELGLPTRDQRVRSTLTAAVIDLIVARAEQSYEIPDDQALRAFYDEHAYYFRAADQVDIEQLYFAGTDAGTRASQATTRARAGASQAELVSRSDPPPLPVPAGAIPAAKLRDYLGPSATRVALALKPGAVSNPVRAAHGFYVLRLVARIHGATRPFDAVRAQVVAEHRRRSSDAALERFLRLRRSRSRITVAEDRL